MNTISTEEYQEFVPTTWTKSDTPLENELRIICGLAEESGEVAGKVKKWFRGDYNLKSETFLHDIENELGDLLYYIATLCNFYNLSIDEIMALNVKKLLDRKERGVIKGSGDDR